MTDHNKFTGLRATGEDDRSTEFKVARDQLVAVVNDWLGMAAAKRDADEALADGITFTDKPRVVRSILGKTAFGMDIMEEHRKPGVSLEGDGIMTPLALQAVRPHDSGTGWAVTEITGSDPLARRFNEGGYSPQSYQETVASFKVTDITLGQDEKYFGYEVRGDGAVYRRYVTTDGVHASQSLRTAEDVQLAADAFTAAQEQVGL